MACKRSSVRPRYSPLSSQEEEIFDILTHKTVSKDFKLKTECFLFLGDNSQFTAESMSETNSSPEARYLVTAEGKVFVLWRKKVRASGGCLGSRRR